MSWEAVLDACPPAAGVQVERPRLEAGEPWCVAQIAGLQFYTYNRPGLDDTPIRPHSGERLNLTRRPDNRADGNAVEVWMRNEHQLGHLPRGLAGHVAPHLDRGVSLRAYALGPGVGTAWSVRVFLVGSPVAEDHGAWLHGMALAAERELQEAEHDAEEWHRAESEAFARRQHRARRDRLMQAVRTFEVLPFDPAVMPEVGETCDPDALAARLGMSVRRLHRLALKAGVRLVVPSRPVVVSSALRAALVAWCSAPAARTEPGAVHDWDEDSNIPF